MDLEEAKAKFIELTTEIKPRDLSKFINWIQESDRFKFKENEDVILENIAAEIREIVPFEAVLPSEKTFVPTEGKNSDCDENVTLHIDSFLYDDEYLDDLVDAGRFSRNYCCKCGSKDTKPYTFISHSSSASSLKKLFKEVLPDLSGKTFVDVGSRLGVVLYAANFYSSCDKIIGIEFNKELCEIQEKIIKKYDMGRIKVVCSDVLDQSELLKSADVLLMNNVFEFFTEAGELEGMWRFVIRSFRGRGKMLVASPSLEESLGVVGLSCVIPAWVEEVGFEPGTSDEDLQDVHLYRLK